MKNQRLRKITAVFCLLIFCAQSVSADLINLNEAHNAFPREIKNFSENLSIPKNLGHVTEVWGKTKPSVILIQDAHGQYQAQKNIRSILRWIQERKKIGTLFIEGGVGKLEPELLKFVPDSSKNQKLLDLLARHAETGGPELFWVEDAKIPAYGIEDPEIYARNLRVFQQVYNEQEKIENAVEAKVLKLQTQASQGASREFYDFFKSWFRYELSQSKDLNLHLAVLKENAKKYLNLDLRDPAGQLSWPMLVRFFEIKNRETKNDLQKIKQEEERLTAWLRKQSGPAADLPSSDTVNRREFWESFYKKYHGLGFEFEDYPAYFFLQGSKILSEELDARALFDEADKLCESLFVKLAKTEEEKSFLDGARQLIFAQKLLRLELTREDYEKRSTDGNLFRGDKAIEEVFQSALNFYKLAGYRDEIMVRNFEEKSSKGENILIAGGFHTAGLTKLLQDKNISYAVITPHFSEIQDSADYEASMMGKEPKWDLGASTLRNTNLATPAKAWRGFLPENILNRREIIRRALHLTPRAEIRTREEELKTFLLQNVKGGGLEKRLTPNALRQLLYLTKPVASEITSILGALPSGKAGQIASVLREFFKKSKEKSISRPALPNPKRSFLEDIRLGTLLPQLENSQAQKFQETFLSLARQAIEKIEKERGDDEAKRKILSAFQLYFDRGVARMLAQFNDQETLKILRNVNEDWRKNKYEDRLGSFLQHFILSRKVFLLAKEYEETQNRVFELVSQVGGPQERLEAWWLYLTATVDHLRHFGFHAEINGIKPEARGIDQETITFLFGKYFLPDFRAWRLQMNEKIHEKGSAAFAMDRRLLWTIGQVFDYRIYDSENANYPFEFDNALRAEKKQPAFRVDASEAFPGGANQSLPYYLKPFLEQPEIVSLLREVLELHRKDHEQGQPAFVWNAALSRLKQVIPSVLARGESLSDIPFKSREKLISDLVAENNSKTRMADSIIQYREDPYKVLGQALEQSSVDGMLRVLADKTRQLYSWSDEEPKWLTLYYQLDSYVKPEDNVQQAAEKVAEKTKDFEKWLEMFDLMHSITTEFHKNPFQTEGRDVVSYDDLQPGTIIKYFHVGDKVEETFFAPSLVLRRWNDADESVLLVGESGLPAILTRQIFPEQDHQMKIVKQLPVRQEIRTQPVETFPLDSFLPRSIRASDAELFEVRYHKKQNVRRIEIYHKNTEVGSVSFFVSRLNTKLHAYAGNNPLSVNGHYQAEYGGIGGALMTLAYRMAQQEGAVDFTVYNNSRLYDFFVQKAKMLPLSFSWFWMPLVTIKLKQYGILPPPVEIQSKNGLGHLKPAPFGSTLVTSRRPSEPEENKMQNAVVPWQVGWDKNESKRDEIRSRPTLEQLQQAVEKKRRQYPKGNLEVGDLLNKSVIISSSDFETEIPFPEARPLIVTPGEVYDRCSFCQLDAPAVADFLIGEGIPAESIQMIEIPENRYFTHSQGLKKSFEFRFERKARFLLVDTREGFYYLNLGNPLLEYFFKGQDIIRREESNFSSAMRNQMKKEPYKPQWPTAKAWLSFDESSKKMRLAFDMPAGEKALQVGMVPVWISTQGQPVFYAPGKDEEGFFVDTVDVNTISDPKEKTEKMSLSYSVNRFRWDPTHNGYKSLKGSLYQFRVPVSSYREVLDKLQTLNGENFVAEFEHSDFYIQGIFHVNRFANQFNALTGAHQAQFYHYVRGFLDWRLREEEDQTQSWERLTAVARPVKFIPIIDEAQELEPGAAWTAPLESYEDDLGFKPLIQKKDPLIPQVHEDVLPKTQQFHVTGRVAGAVMPFTKYTAGKQISERFYLVLASMSKIWDSLKPHFVFALPEISKEDAGVGKNPVSRKIEILYQGNDGKWRRAGILQGAESYAAVPVTNETWQPIRILQWDSFDGEPVVRRLIALELLRHPNGDFIVRKKSKKIININHPGSYDSSTGVPQIIESLQGISQHLDNRAEIRSAGDYWNLSWLREKTSEFAERLMRESQDKLPALIEEITDFQNAVYGIWRKRNDYDNVENLLERLSQLAGEAQKRLAAVPGGAGKSQDQSAEIEKLKRRHFRLDSSEWGKRKSIRDPAATPWISPADRPAAVEDVFRKLDLKPGQRLLEIGPETGGGIGLIAAKMGLEVVLVDLPRNEEWLKQLGESMTVIGGDFSDPAIQAKVAALGPFEHIIFNDVVDPIAAAHENTWPQMMSMFGAIAELAKNAKTLYISMRQPEEEDEPGFMRPAYDELHWKWEKSFPQSVPYDRVIAPNSRGLVKARIYHFPSTAAENAADIPMPQNYWAANLVKLAAEMEQKIKSTSPDARPQLWRRFYFGAEGEAMHPEPGALIGMLQGLYHTTPDDQELVKVLKELNLYWKSKGWENTMGRFLQHFIMSQKIFADLDPYIESQRRIIRLVAQVGTPEDRLWAWWLYLTASVYHLRGFGLHVETLASDPAKRVAIDQDIIVEITRDHFLPEYRKWRWGRQVELADGRSPAGKMNHAMLWALGAVFDYRIYDSEGLSFHWKRSYAHLVRRGERPYNADPKDLFPGGAAQSLPHFLIPMLRALPEPEMRQIFHDILELRQQLPDFYVWDGAVLRLLTIVPNLLAGSGTFDTLLFTSRQNLLAIEKAGKRHQDLSMDLYKVEPYAALRKALDQASSFDQIPQMLVENTRKENLYNWKDLEGILEMAVKFLKSGGLKQEPFFITKLNVPAESIEVRGTQEAKRLTEAIREVLGFVGTDFHSNPFEIREEPVSSWESLQPGMILRHYKLIDPKEMDAWHTHVLLAKVSSHGQEGLLFISEDGHPRVLPRTRFEQMKNEFRLQIPGSGVQGLPEPFTPVRNSGRPEIRSAIAVPEKIVFTNKRENPAGQNFEKIDSGPQEVDPSAAVAQLLQKQGIRTFGIYDGFLASVISELQLNVEMRSKKGFLSKGIELYQLKRENKSPLYALKVILSQKGLKEERYWDMLKRKAALFLEKGNEFLVSTSEDSDGSEHGLSYVNKGSAMRLVGILMRATTVRLEYERKEGDVIITELWVDLNPLFPDETGNKAVGIRSEIRIVSEERARLYADILSSAGTIQHSIFNAAELFKPINMAAGKTARKKSFQTSLQKALNQLTLNGYLSVRRSGSPLYELEQKGAALLREAQSQPDPKVFLMETLKNMPIKKTVKKTGPKTAPKRKDGRPRFEIRTNPKDLKTREFSDPNEIFSLLGPPDTPGKTLLIDPVFLNEEAEIGHISEVEEKALAIISQFGMFFIHGNILLDKVTGRAVVIMGRPGNGKSLLSKKLIAKGRFEFIQDDSIIAFFDSDGKLFVGPAAYRTGPSTFRDKEGARLPYVEGDAVKYHFFPADTLILISKEDAAASHSLQSGLLKDQDWEISSNMGTPRPFLDRIMRSSMFGIHAQIPEKTENRNYDGLAEEISAIIEQRFRSEIRTAETAPNLKGSFVLLMPGTQPVTQSKIGKDFYDRYPVYREVFDRAAKFYGDRFDLIKIAFEGSTEELNRLKNSQPVQVVMAYAVYELLKSELGEDFKIGAVAGSSLNEITAMMISGAISFEDGLRMALFEGEKLESLAEKHEGDIAWIHGMDLESGRRLAAEQGVDISIVSGPRTFNISGPAGNIQKAVEAAAAIRGVKARIHPMHIAPHSPMLREAVESLREKLLSIEAHVPKVPFIAASGEYVNTVEEVRQRIWERLLAPVFWDRVQQTAYAGGARRFVEIGTANQSAHLVTQKEEGVKTFFAGSRSEPAVLGDTLKAISQSLRSEIRSVDGLKDQVDFLRASGGREEDGADLLEREALSFPSLKPGLRFLMIEDEHLPDEERISIHGDGNNVTDEAVKEYLRTGIFPQNGRLYVGSLTNEIKKWYLLHQALHDAFFTSLDWKGRKEFLRLIRSVKGKPGSITAGQDWKERLYDLEGLSDLIEAYLKEGRTFPESKIPELAGRLIALSEAFARIAGKFMGYPYEEGGNSDYHLRKFKGFFRKNGLELQLRHEIRSAALDYKNLNWVREKTAYFEQFTLNFRVMGSFMAVQDDDAIPRNVLEQAQKELIEFENGLLAYWKPRFTQLSEDDLRKLVAILDLLSRYGNIMQARILYREKIFPKETASGAASDFEKKLQPYWSALDEGRFRNQHAWNEFYVEIVTEIGSIFSRYSDPAELSAIFKAINSFWIRRGWDKRLGDFSQILIMSYKHFMYAAPYERTQDFLFELIRSTFDLEDRLWAWHVYMMASVSHLRHFGFHVEKIPGEKARAIDNEVIVKIFRRYFVPDYLEWRKQNAAEISKPGTAAFQMNRDMLWAFGLPLDIRIHDSETLNYPYTEEDFQENPKVLFKDESESIVYFMKALLENENGGLAPEISGLLNQFLELYRQDSSQENPYYAWDASIRSLHDLMPDFFRNGYSLKSIHRIQNPRLNLLMDLAKKKATAKPHSSDQFKIKPYEVLGEAYRHSSGSLAAMLEYLKDKTFRVTFQDVQNMILYWRGKLIDGQNNTLASLTGREALISRPLLFPNGGEEIVAQIISSLKLIGQVGNFYRPPFQYGKIPVRNAAEIQPGDLLWLDGRAAQDGNSSVLYVMNEMGANTARFLVLRDNNLVSDLRLANFDMNKGLLFKLAAPRFEIRTAAVLAVAKNVTNRILSVGSEFYELLFAKKDPEVKMSEKELAQMTAAYLKLFEGNGSIVLPAEALDRLSDSSFTEYWKPILGALNQKQGKGPRIYIAGDTNGKIRNKILAGDFLKAYPLLRNRIKDFIRVENQNMPLVLNRLKDLPSVSIWDKADGVEKSALKIPGFLLKADEIKELTGIQYFRYLHSMTQLQLLVADQLKGISSSLHREKAEFLVARALTQAGVKFQLDSQGFFRPDRDSLLAEDLTARIASSRLSAQAA